MWGISQQAEGLLVSQERLCTMELDNQSSVENLKLKCVQIQFYFFHIDSELILIH
jgi:hypothetical protein